MVVGVNGDLLLLVNTFPVHPSPSLYKFHHQMVSARFHVDIHVHACFVWGFFVTMGICMHLRRCTSKKYNRNDYSAMRLPPVSTVSLSLVYQPTIMYCVNYAVKIHGFSSFSLWIIKPIAW